jgi:hypothetical protein
VHTAVKKFSNYEGPVVYKNLDASRSVSVAQFGLSDHYAAKYIAELNSI